MDVEARVLSEQLIADLRADRRSMNATRAQERLAALWPHSERALESALGSPERQVRFLASQVLRRKLAMPTESLLRAAVEDLADDGGGLLAGYLAMGNAWEAAAYLRRFPDLARPLLVDIIRTGDWQQRFIGAAIMAQCEMSDLAGLAAPILIEHLGDNDIEDDASLAAPLLLSLGEPIADLLESHRHDADAQRRQLCRAILARLGRPTDPAHPELDRPPRVTGRMIDPLDLVVR